MEGKGKFGIDMYTLLYLKRINKKDLLYSTGNSAQCYVAAWTGEGSLGKRDPCIRMAESLHYSHETITTFLIGYTMVQNIFGVKN